MELQRNDLYWAVTRLPQRLRGLMKQRGARCLVAGGFIRSVVSGEPVSDIDIFAPDKEYAENYCQFLALGPQYKTTHFSQNAFTVKYNDGTPTIQIIHRWTFNTPEEIIKSFDYTIAKAVIWCSDDRSSVGHRPVWSSLAHPDFYADLAAKRLVYTSPERNEDAGGSILRLLKFYQRGYRIPLDSLGAVVARLVGGMQPDKIKVLMEGDGAMKHEAAMAQVLTGLLHEVDPQIDPEHFFHLPSELSENAGGD